MIGDSHRPHSNLGLRTHGDLSSKEHKVWGKQGPCEGWQMAPQLYPCWVDDDVAPMLFST